MILDFILRNGLTAFDTWLTCFTVIAIMLMLFDFIYFHTVTEKDALERHNNSRS